MSAIDEGIVREYFEQNGFLVRQARKYQVQARRKAAEKVRDVAADTPLFQVFRKDGKRSYLAFNAGKAPITVRFSDGQTLAVPPGQLARARQP